MTELQTLAPDPRHANEAGARRVEPRADSRSFALSKHETRVVVARSINEVEATRWDALAGSNILASHGWLRNAEACFPEAEPRYILLYQDEDLVAASMCERVQPNQAGFSPERLMLRRFSGPARKLGVSWLPALTCVPFRSYDGHLMLDPRLLGAARREAMDLGLDAVEEHSFSGQQALWFPRVRADSETAELLRRRGYHETRANPVAFIDIEWDSIDGYLAAVRKISKNARKTVRAEMLRFERSGVVIEEIDDPERHRDRLHELADQHHRRLNNVPVPYPPQFLPGLKRTMGSEAVLYGAFEGGRLIGFSLMLRRDGIGYLPYTGIEPSTTRESYAYFHLCYYRPIADAIATGMQRLYAGTALYAMKARRGYSVQGMRVFYRSASRVRHTALGPAFKLHADWRERKAQRHGHEDVERLRRTSPA